MAKKTLVITGGGSGGHVYPGIAIAKSIQATHPDWDIVFVGAEGGLEQKIVPENNFPLHLLKIGRIRSSVGIIRQLMTLLSIPLAIISAFVLYFKLKPKAVLGVGGFASFPFLLVSLFMRAKTFTWEGNAYPGLVNRKLGRWADKNFLVFEDAKKIQPVNAEVIGIPIRSDFFQLKKLKSPTPPFKVLVFGGSQGSQAINLVVQKMLIQYQTMLSDFNFIHQTGLNNFENINSEYLSNNVTVNCVPYIANMPEILNDVHICICRSGASTVAECCATLTPAIFIPLPSAADDHQTKNAQSIVNAGGAMMLKQSELTPESLYDQLMKFRQDPNLINRLSASLGKFDFKNVDKKIADSIVGGVV